MLYNQTNLFFYLRTSMCFNQNDFLLMNSWHYCRLLVKSFFAKQCSQGLFKDFAEFQIFQNKNLKQVWQIFQGFHEASKTLCQLYKASHVLYKFYKIKNLLRPRQIFKKFQKSWASKTLRKLSKVSWTLKNIFNFQMPTNF